jgi:hypothetical protein
MRGFMIRTPGEGRRGMHGEGREMQKEGDHSEYTGIGDRII